MTTPLSVIIICGNAKSDILNCLKSCQFASEIILVAANSTDLSIQIAKKHTPRIKVYKTFDAYNSNFTKWRNIGFKRATQPWILYLDTDEVVSFPLRQEIIGTIKSQRQLATYYAIPRQNYFLGHRVRYGNTYPDYVKRLYRRQFFQGYQGILHEEPIVSGQIGYLSSNLVHRTHINLSSMLQKSIVWTGLEAYELHRHHHPPVVWWRFFRVMLTKLFQRLISQNFWRDGIVGLISVIFEVFDTYMIYANLYEFQNLNG